MFLDPNFAQARLYSWILDATLSESPYTGCRVFQGIYQSLKLKENFLSEATNFHIRAF